MFERETTGDVTLLRMCHGKASALDLEFLREISRTFDELARSDTRAVVLTGTGGIFSAGVDLKRLVSGGVDYIRDFMPALNDAFSKMFFFPRPLVAACNGHAIAGGGVMLCCADVRYAARGKGRIGVPELLVGVPFPLIALEIVRFAVRPDRAQEIAYTGRSYDVDTALDRGLCEELFEPDELLERATARARELATIPMESFRFTKAAMRVGVSDILARRAEELDAEALELWCSDEVREAVRAYVEKTLG